MPKEYWVAAGIALLVLSSVLDSFAGPVSLIVGRNPFAFLSAASLGTYPLTAVAIGVRAVGVFILAVTTISAIDKQYFLKAVGVLILGVLVELYAVQQLATGAQTTPLNWTLAFAYAGALLLPAIFYYLLRGAFSGVSSQVSGEPEEPAAESEKRVEKMKEISKDEPDSPESE